jgi:hypothetical protein
VRPPTFVRCNLPWLSHAWTVHLLIPPNRFAASCTESRFSKACLPTTRTSLSHRWNISLTCRLQGSTFNTMPSKESHGIDKREFTGERSSEKLLRWLNGPTKDEQREIIRELLRDIRRATERWEFKECRVRDQTLGMTGEGWSCEYSGPEEGRKEHYRALKRINAAMRRYKFYPLIFANARNRMVDEWIPISGPAGKYRGTWIIDWDYGDFRAVQDIMALARAQVLNRVRECACGTWFFQRFQHQRFCSSKCREKEFRSSEKSKAYRRARARHYYYLHKNKNVVTKPRRGER